MRHPRWAQRLRGSVSFPPPPCFQKHTSPERPTAGEHSCPMARTRPPTAPRGQRPGRAAGEGTSEAGRVPAGRGPAALGVKWSVASLSLVGLALILISFLRGHFPHGCRQSPDWRRVTRAAATPHLVLRQPRGAAGWPPRRVHGTADPGPRLALRTELVLIVPRAPGSRSALPLVLQLAQTGWLALTHPPSLTRVIGNLAGQDVCGAVRPAGPGRLLPPAHRR